MTRQFALALLVLAAVAPALAAESDSVRVNASRYQPVPDGVAVSIAFANPAQKDRDLETLLAERLLIDWDREAGNFWQVIPKEMIGQYDVSVFGDEDQEQRA